MSLLWVIKPDISTIHVELVLLNVWQWGWQICLFKLGDGNSLWKPLQWVGCVFCVYEHRWWRQVNFRKVNIWWGGKQYFNTPCILGAGWSGDNGCHTWKTSDNFWVLISTFRMTWLVIESSLFIPWHADFFSTLQRYYNCHGKLFHILPSIFHFLKPVWGVSFCWSGLCDSYFY